MFPTESVKQSFWCYNPYCIMPLDHKILRFNMVPNSKNVPFIFDGTDFKTLGNSFYNAFSVTRLYSVDDRLTSE
jgi:hypothetical protein